MKFEHGVLRKWLDAWGYTDSPGSLHLFSDAVPASHAYRTELCGLLNPAGDIKAKAIFDVEGVPTICFLQSSDGDLEHDAVLHAVRERAWNQNLISIVLIVDDNRALATPTACVKGDFEEVRFQQANRFGEFSRADIQSGEVFSRHPLWFAPENRVDRKLLSNLSLVVGALARDGLDKKDAQLLMAQVMFVAYLEHRGIAGQDYRAQHGVGSLFKLVQQRDREGIAKLMKRLKADFNGDLLEPDGGSTVWSALSDSALDLLDDFLTYVDISTGQRDFWHYDFRFIPVELISGIYESFLSEEKRNVGAFYTPRHLATLAVDQAFAVSQNILEERIFDGACGSGILLTTAYRRMLAYGEATTGNQWSFARRVELLKRSIFGSDTNESACRVTAFSLYLSVLENLQPADLVRLAETGDAKLPTLASKNIFAGDEGDFFSKKNPLVERGNFTLILSNPPWVEPKGGQVLSSDIWAQVSKVKIPRRQLCAAFMLRALDAANKDNGRFCFILPVSILGAPTSQEFVKTWLRHCEIDTVINFGDLRKLLFENAKQPTVVVVARPRRPRAQIPTPEVFQYWTPKSDVSLAFGRLAVHGSDRHLVQTSLLRNDNSILTTLFWGNHQDQAMITRLELHGQVENLFKRPGWRAAKGFHKKDSLAEDLVSTEPIAQIPYLNARKFATDGPLLDEAALETKLPDEIQEVPNLSDELIALFSGPRIVFTDGMTTEREVCAGFSSKQFSFNSSTGAIVAPETDVDVLRFLAVYLHSDLVRYLLLLTAYQISFERERVSLLDIKRLPFVHPENHPNRQRAEEIVQAVAGLVRDLEKSEKFGRVEVFARWRDQAENLIAEYFGLTPVQIGRVREIVKFVLPSVQPSTYANLVTPLQVRPSDQDMQNYQATLLAELSDWRDAMGGVGMFDASFAVGSPQSHGALAILRLDVVPNKGLRSNPVPPEIADAAVAALVAQMKQRQLLPLQIQENLYLASDIVVRQEDSLYLIKPMVRRLWLQGEAIRDAERFVRFVQGTVE